MRLKYRFKILLQLLFVILFSSINKADADCGALCNYYDVDTLSEGVVEIKCMIDSAVYSIDTSSRQDMISKMIYLFDSVNYCFIGRIDSVHQFYLPPDSKGKRYGADSVRVIIDTCLKGDFKEPSFWGIDRIRTPMDGIDSLGNPFLIVSSVSAGNYRSIIGRNIILVADSLSDLRKCGIEPQGMCVSEIRGYTIDDNNRINNLYLFPYIDISLDQFLQAIDTSLNAPVAFYSRVPNAQSNVFLNPVGHHIIISLLGNELLANIGLYNVNGQLIHSYRFLNNKHFILKTNILSSGIYILMIRTGQRQILKEFILHK